MRRFSAEYLAETREGLWADRSALAPLSLDDRSRVVDVGCGSGALTDVLREEVPANTQVVGVDADRELLGHAKPPVIQGGASQLPFPGDIADLVTCQALLVNLPDPVVALEEFNRVSSDLVGVIEPDNSAVAVDSTVESEGPLAAAARESYIEGISTDVTLGRSAAEYLREAGLSIVATRTHHHERVIEPPYSESALEGARRKARGSQLLAAEETLRAGGMDQDAFQALLADWQAMGRTVIEQMSDERYRRAEVIPFHVVVGRVVD